MCCYGRSDGGGGDGGGGGGGAEGDDDCDGNNDDLVHLIHLLKASFFRSRQRARATGKRPQT